MESIIIEQNNPDVVVVVKRKKGRPRKDAGNTIVENVIKHPEEKKKRGRKKKECVVEEVKQKKKRGRKAAVKYFSSSIRKKIPLTTVLQDSNNYILHLDVKDDIEKKETMTYDSKNDNDVDILFKKLDINTNEDVEFQKEYSELLDNDNSILSDFIDELNSEEIEYDQDHLRKLYEKRIEFREKQDNLLVNKLESLHKDEEFINKLIVSSETNNKNENLTKIDINIQEMNRKKGFFEILHKHINNSKWLEKCDTACWWCCHTFDTLPIGMPDDYNVETKKFRVKGIFCSFSCMVAYKQQNSRVDKLNKQYLVKHLYNKLTGTILIDSHITPAPPRCSLKMFGGELTIEEFRNSTIENKIYKMIEYPMFVSNDYIEEIDIQNVKAANTKVFKESTTNLKIYNLDDKRVEDAKMRLSQIEKSTVTVGNTIDRFIKFS
jgi:hypothetical protein